ncbi:choice-of-anchor A family protein [Undibacterium flavidum]|uniref:Choice-of-anchor A family protein n=1 Tax=Undibacterium flavidum TaxID=2762297 RepID=A0ABR6YAY1_9BURK|nr:choice-of-anchor A family protein [Undibacterium flavidum]MBC3873737.1 choice-of-anchor A family protein [Undibacterium flavidum]
MQRKQDRQSKMHAHKTPNKGKQMFKQVWLTLCVWGSLSAAAYAQQIDLGVAAQYSGFFFGNVSKIPDIEGRMALGGDLDVGGASIGGRVPAGSTQASLVVGGNLVSFTGGTIWSNGHTNSWGEYVGTKSNNVAKYHDLRKVNVSPIDFAAERTYLTILSQQLRDTPPTGTVSQLYAEVTLTGSNRDIEFFNLKAEQVKSTLNFALKNIKPTAYVILNVAADEQRKLRLSINMKAFAGRNQRTLFNLHDTDVLNMLNVRVEGSVLAPYACVKDSSGHLEGTIVAASWDNSMEIGYGPFLPTK